MTHESKARRLATLLAGYMRGTLNEEEHNELDEWVGASDKNMKLFEELTDKGNVNLALKILNEDQEGLVMTLLNDEEFTFPTMSERAKGFMEGVIVGIVIEIILMQIV